MQHYKFLSGRDFSLSQLSFLLMLLSTSNRILRLFSTASSYSQWATMYLEVRNQDRMDPPKIKLIYWDFLDIC